MPPTIKLPDTSLAAHGRVELGPEITVALSAYGNFSATLSTLQALFLSARGDFELLLVDNASPDEQVRALLRQARTEHANTTLIAFEQNREYSGALNAILSHGRGQWILFLSNDIFVTPYYLREILAAARASDRHGIVRGSSNFVDNGKPTHNVRLTGDIRSYEDLFACGKMAAEQLPAELLVDEFLTGDAFLVSRPLLDRIGTIDPAYFGYFADHDFGIRAQIAGFQQILVRRAFAFHEQHANFNCLSEEAKRAKLEERWARVFQNWNVFKAKFGLPADLAYTNIADIPWKTLAAQPFDPAKHYVAPGNFLAESR